MTALQIRLACEATSERLRKSLLTSELPSLYCYEACMEIAAQLAELNHHFEEVDAAVFGDKKV